MHSTNEDHLEPAPTPINPSDPPPIPDSHPITGNLYGPPEGALATSHVGNYTLYGTIGEGAFGKVKVAVHRGSNVRVAVKIMDKREIRAQEFTSQVRREIYIMRRLKHRHIVRMHEVLTSDTRLYIVMELVTGGELFGPIAAGRIPEHLARRYFQQLVDGVAFCHKKGVAHRDLKPENLLLDENGDIKITDFGFSSMKGMDVHTGLLYTQCGTPDYCAPEIIDNAQNGYTGSKVDAWSCGIILYALLCGRLPFQELNTDKLYELILTGTVKYPPHISPSARDLLENLLIRDPIRRFDLLKVKRHPWFLIDYDGDDARLLKKRPFFNKNQKDLIGSGPPSPVVMDLPQHAQSSPLTNGAQLPLNDPDYVAPPPALQSTLYMDPAAAHSADGRRLLGTQDSNQQPEPLMDAGTPRNIHAAARPLRALSRLRDDAQNGYRPNSPYSMDIQARAPTPPAHDVITRVQDRPATPAQRRTNAEASHAFNAAVAAFEAPVSPVAPASPAAFNGHALHNRSSPGGVPPGAYITPVHASRPESIPTGIPVAANGPGYVFPRPADVQVPARDDDMYSDQDSIEDYEEKPAPMLEMPSDPRQFLRTTKEGRRQIHSLPHPGTLRHRSDLAGAAANGVANGSLPVLANPLEQSSASLSALQRPRRAFARDATNSGSVNEARPFRPTRTSDVPESPPVVYSPSSLDGPAFDRFRPVSPGFNNMRGGLHPDGSPNGVYASNGAPIQHPWHTNNANGYVASRDESGNGTKPGTPMTLQTEILLRHHWSMLCKWRGSSEPANPKVSQELRQDLRLFLNEMKQINRLEDKANLFTNFLIMFERIGLSDIPVSSPGFGSQNTDEEYETGPDSREGQSMSGELRGNLPRLAPTDISSEEEPLSWSPVVADINGPQTSDLARRRNLSDLLNRWINRTDNASQVRVEDGAGPEEPSQIIDVMELQKLMREHHGGREESNLADDLLRMMNFSEDGNSTPFSTMVGGMPGHSPPSSHGPPRSSDSHGQAVRYHSNGGLASNGTIGRLNHARSVSNNNTPLPSEYIPGRFREPNSMPARGRNGNDRVTGLASRGTGRTPSNDVGDTIGIQRNLENMASSMGMHDVAYYTSDRKSGMANKLRGVLQTMKAKNHRLGEHFAQFQSDLSSDVIMRILGRVLQDMGARVTIQRETKRKMKSELRMPGWTLHAGIELMGLKDGMTRVAFRRSRADRGKTDTQSFHSFFMRVQSTFAEEARSRYPSSRFETSTPPKRRRDHMESNARHIDDTSGVSMTS